ncbi:RagB/SusD family nutrient uptake outer membrane protein, partial [uncultured Duncaniella sp.]|uniref:RagB/SusD family nutrient uptake outer membrane protein n=1 Tax=uncultured Duncaniella sp. TaxID=2768039 RepID=UPI0025B1452F
AEWPVKVKNLYERILADLLPIDWDKTSISVITNGNNQRRINKVMALAYLGKNYLWAASPLMNYSSTGSREYNREYAQKAADAFGELLNLVEKGATQYELVSYDKIGEVFYSYGQNGRMPGLTEVIFRGPEWDPWQNTRYGLALQYVPTPYHPDGGGNNLSPCANYVNYYGMANGLPIDDPESLWDKTHPWKDRDPRFYNDIVFDGCLITDNYQNPLPNIELFTSGASRDINTASRTGYSLKKFLHPTCNRYDDGWGWSPQFTIGISYLRLADVYLMYAEAAAQASGSPSGKSAACQLSALDAINKIRQRAGVENVNSKFTGNIDSFMSELRRERAVELSFEGHRFNDLRRWMLIDKPEYANKTSVEFKRTGDFDPAHPENNAVSGYHEEVIVSRSYSEKHYWLPLKKSDCNISAEFKQNPGW